MTLYMAVTADAYELPLIVEESPSALAKRLGIRSNQVSTACSGKRKNHSGKRRGYRIVRVECPQKSEPALACGLTTEP
ncbi:MAG: hypothetical protein VB099_16465 [Candidatus Limiplasma sp.]|nr:hypothetical protein [Candidatus Limiplasma sp.]